MLAIISLIISAFSGIAAIFAILGYWGNKPELIQFMETNNDSYVSATEGQISYIGDDGKKYYLPSGIMVHYQFLNPSPKDIAFFHLNFIVNGNITEAFTERSVITQAKKPSFLFFDLLKSYIIQFPKYPQGVFPANSLTPIYAFLPLEAIPVPEKVTFSIRFAIRKFPYIGKRNHYQTFEHTVYLNDYEMITRSNRAVMKQLRQSGPHTLKSNKITSKNRKRKN